MTPRLAQTRPRSDMTTKAQAIDAVEESWTSTASKTKLLDSLRIMAWEPKHLDFLLNTLRKQRSRHQNTVQDIIMQELVHVADDARTLATVPETLSMVKKAIHGDVKAEASRRGITLLVAEVDQQIELIADEIMDEISRR